MYPKARRILLFSLLHIFTFTILGQSIIPLPADMCLDNVFFDAKDKPIGVYANDRGILPLPLLCGTIMPQSSIAATNDADKANLHFIKDCSLPREGYILKITEERIAITASDKNGAIYALQTLRQLEEENNNGRYRCAVIIDSPRAAWRGFMLDSGRQYQSIATIKKYIDMASMLKMNIFHWHLTEGLGWRIEIKRYPNLTSHGAYVGKGEEQQGYYTQEEIRDIVAYAGERGITIVPEIDMPGHSEAALSSYPELGCFGTAVEIPQQGYTRNIFCAGKDSTIIFLKNVLDEVCTLFRSEYIHIGGDEAPKENWAKCPDCQKRITEIGLKSNEELQSWFSSQMAEHLKAKGRKAIFWEDVIYTDSCPLPDNAIIQWWNYRSHGNEALNKAIKKGIPVICSSNYYTYLNFPVTPWKGYGKERTFSIKECYNENPSYMVMQKGIPLILGMTCALWTDYELTENMLDRRLFPRILALAQQMWHKGEPIPYENFIRAVQDKKEWFKSQGYEFGAGTE